METLKKSNALLNEIMMTIGRVERTEGKGEAKTEEKREVPDIEILNKSEQLDGLISSC